MKKISQFPSTAFTLGGKGYDLTHFPNESVAHLIGPIDWSQGGVQAVSSWVIHDVATLDAAYQRAMEILGVKN